MAKSIPRDEVLDLLVGMGLVYVSAKQAAEDERITWTDEAIVACLHDIKHSGMKKPAGALWNSYLLHGQLPPVPKVKPIPDPNAIDTTCPVCKGDIRDCRGMHGFVLKVPCWICQKPLSACLGACKPAVAVTRRSTRNKRREDAA